MTIADKLDRVRDRIARAAEKAGRSAEDVTLVGVTKYVGAAEAGELVASGCRVLGESRPQELWKKVEALLAEPPAEAGSPAHGVRWHLIGHLQRNKVRRTLPLVSLIHSVDSERLLAAIDEAWKGESSTARQEPRPPTRILLEVNCSGEVAKHGLMPGDVEPLVAAAARFPHVAVCGLMTMAALAGGPDTAARNFAALRELRDRLQPNAPDGVRLEELSMGMSRDFEIAIAEGSTIVRVGSALWQ